MMTSHPQFLYIATEAEPKSIFGSASLVVPEKERNLDFEATFYSFMR